MPIVTNFIFMFKLKANRIRNPEYYEPIVGTYFRCKDSLDIFGKEYFRIVSVTPTTWNCKWIHPYPAKDVANCDMEYEQWKQGVDSKAYIIVEEDEVPLHLRIPLNK